MLKRIRDSAWVLALCMTQALAGPIRLHPEKATLYFLPYNGP